MTSQHTTYNKLKETAKRYQIERGEKLGVDNTTISKDIKALKLISQQFIYDITKSDFTYYYKQCLDAVKLILRKQYEIVDKERITKEDVWTAKILADMLNTVSTINDHYKAAPDMHQSPMQKVFSEERFGIRPGTNKTRVHKLTDEDMKSWEEDEAAEEAEFQKAFEDKTSLKLT